MPHAPPHPCAGPCCGTTVPKGTKYCGPCKTKAHARDRAQRGSARERGYDTRWEKRRLLYLRKHPLCVVCEAKGLVVPATEVDHIVPHRGDAALFDDEGNWQALCKSCHSRKTATKDRVRPVTP